ncbi:MAG: MATE family efflux transporter [Clostridia bacterium]|nr:MATE family efflux transporter [Clostridia bacterium]
MASFSQKARDLFAPKDMCQGTPWKRIAEFAFPMLIGNFAQQLYSTVDAIVVGKSAWGYDGLAAVGNAGPVINLLLALFVGISTGAGILVSQYFGAKDKENLSKTIGNCITITAIACVIIMIAGPLLTGPLLNAMGTLKDLYSDSKAYLDINFYGIAGFFFYNIFSGILRGLGDSITALVILIITSVVNIVLDIALVDKMGVAGVALATIIAQFISAGLCLWKLLKMKDLFSINKSTLRVEKRVVVGICKLGLPSGITQAIFSVAMMVVQGLINGFEDSMFVACNVMVMRVDGYAMLPNFSFGQAMGTFAGQNIGAKRIDRLASGTKQGLIMALLTAVVLTPLVLLGGPFLMGLFTDEKTLVEMAMGMMYILAVGYIAMSVTQVLSGTMRGAGDTMTPMWISFLTTVAIRVPLAYGLVYLAKNAGASVLMQEKMVFVSLLCAWLLGAAVTGFMYMKGSWKKKQVNAIEMELRNAAK